MDRRSRQFRPSTDSLEGRQMLSTVSSTASSLNPFGSTTPQRRPGRRGGPAPADDRGQAPARAEPPLLRRPARTRIAFRPPAGDGPEYPERPRPASIARLHQGNSSDDLDLQPRPSAGPSRTRTSPPPGQRGAQPRLRRRPPRPPGPPRSTVADLQAQLTHLVHYDTTQAGSHDRRDQRLRDGPPTRPSASGRPLVYPNVPALASPPTTTATPARSPSPTIRLPSLTGNYVDRDQHPDRRRQQPGRPRPPRPSAATTGAYTVKFANTYLPDGTYTVRVRAEDAGYLSDPSPKYTFNVGYTPPKPRRRSDRTPRKEPAEPGRDRRVRLDLLGGRDRTMAPPSTGSHEGRSRRALMKTKTKHRKTYKWKKKADSSPVAKGRRVKRHGVRNPRKRKHLGGAGL